MNKRQTKKFCKKGGYYHFDKTIREISHKRLMHPYVARDSFFNYMITWHAVGTCMTCEHCTDVMIDWNGEPYMCYSSTIGCGGCDKFTCKRYRLEKDLKFFKFALIHPDSPESDAKKYIEERIKNDKDDSAASDLECSISEYLDKSLLDYLDYLDQEFAGDQIDQLYIGDQEEDENG